MRGKIRTLVGVCKLVPALFRGLWYAHKVGDEVETVTDEMIKCDDCIVQGGFLPCEEHKAELDTIMEKFDNDS